MRSNYRLPIVAASAGVALLTLAACLRSVEVRPDTTADGRPLVEVCAEFAKAHGSAAVAATAAPRAVATVVPSAAPAIPRVE